MNILIIDDGLLPFDKSSAKAFGKAELLRLEREHRVLNRELARAFAARAQNVLMVSAAEDGAAAPGHFEYSGEGGVLTLAAAVVSLIIQARAQRPRRKDDMSRT